MFKLAIGPISFRTISMFPISRFPEMTSSELFERARDSIDAAEDAATTGLWFAAIHAACLYTAQAVEVMMHERAAAKSERLAGK